MFSVYEMFHKGPSDYASLKRTKENFLPTYPPYFCYQLEQETTIFFFGLIVLRSANLAQKVMLILQLELLNKVHACTFTGKCIIKTCISCIFDIYENNCECKKKKIAFFDIMICRQSIAHINCLYMSSASFAC